MKNKNSILNSIERLRIIVANLLAANKPNQTVEQLKFNLILNRNCLGSQQRILENLVNEIQKENENA
ncbi:TPA: hypothetical protein ACT9AU_001893 [Legionella pneumophila]|nr:hypothetical protein [Legionella pneumophila]HAU0941416.1 hypothetical protein [Legionella pneumophila]HDO7873627.1 hypothetical protein [Legionella pneumophila]HDO7940526.1 hypothetical protein [Legionella pneumophila]HDO8157870.1 hypothetical protein [Legionella pneumophila]